MDARWSRVQELVDAAEQRPAAERQAWLETAEPDAGLRTEAAALLAALAAEQAANEQARRAPAPASRPLVIGPYRILESAGAGGLGVVYRAVREVAGGTQEVALKVLRDGATGPEALERFRREQRILAGLNHPSIARLFDAGTDDQGRAYLAMEWVEGDTLDARAAEADLRQRVRWLADALDALNAAHQSLVVHLDLKPSNILVDGAGRVRLIDFGTAKLLAEDGRATGTRQLTPGYASPEQLRGEPATAASDLYSAGLVLYRLATGQERHGSSLAALAERASTAHPAPVAIAGEPDLTAIVAQATQFVPAARYRSAAEFADDLRAWLAGRPVRARRATAGYWLRLFLARHARAAAAGAVAALALAGLAGYAWRQQRLRLEEAERATAIAGFLRGMIDSSATAASGRANMTVLEMVERAGLRLEQGAPVPADVGALLGSDLAYFARESGRDELAERLARAALRRAETTASAPARIAARQALAEVVQRRGRCAEAVKLFQEADAWLPDARLAPVAQASYLAARAAAKSSCEAQPAAAVELLRAAIGHSARASGANTALPPVVLRASLHNRLVLELARLQRFAEAREAARAGLAEAAAHPDGRYFEVALRRTLGQAEARAGRPDAALAAYDEALARAPGVAGRFEILRLELMAAAQQAASGRRDAAAGRVRRTLERVDAEAEALGPARWMLFADAAEVLARSEACREALALYRRADTLTGSQMPRDWAGNRYFFSAGCQAKTDPAQASALARRALESYGAQLPADAPRRRLLEEWARGDFSRSR